MSERVSAILPVRDGEAYLGEALDSILAQTVTAAEVLVVDDGSRDRSAEIASGYGPPVRCIRNPGDGIGAALNLGMDESSGEILAFLDADDLWTPRKLELQLAAIGEDPGNDVVFGRVEQFHSPELSAKWRARIPLPAGSAAGFIRGAMLVRRRAVERVGGWVEDRRLGEFIDWYARAQDHGLRQAVVPEIVLRRRLHTANHSGAGRSGDYQDYPRVLNEVLRRRRTERAP